MNTEQTSEDAEIDWDKIYDDYFDDEDKKFFGEETKTNHTEELMKLLKV